MAGMPRSCYMFRTCHTADRESFAALNFSVLNFHVLIFACLIFATWKKILTAKISRSTVVIIIYVCAKRFDRRTYMCLHTYMYVLILHTLSLEKTFLVTLKLRSTVQEYFMTSGNDLKLMTMIIWWVLTYTPIYMYMYISLSMYM